MYFARLSTYAAAVGFLFLAGMATAAPLVLSKRSAHSRGAEGFPAAHVEFSEKAFAAIASAGEPVTVLLEVPGKGVLPATIKANTHSVVAPGAKLALLDAAGRVVSETLLPSSTRYVGSFDGFDDSYVHLSLVDGEVVYGHITVDGTTYSVEPDPTAGATHTSLVSDSSLLEKEGMPMCAGAPLRPGAPEVVAEWDPALPPRPRDLFAASYNRVVEITYYSTYEVYSRFGGDGNRIAQYVTGLVGDVSAIYERDVDTKFFLKYVGVYTQPNDPFSGSSSLPYLEQFTSIIGTGNSLPLEARADLYQLIDPNPGWGGVAWLDTIRYCDTHRTSYAGMYFNLNFPTSGYQWDVVVAAHEIGHNLASPHTHCYVPPLDRCYNVEPGCYSGPAFADPSTLMSYCHLIDSRLVSMSFSDAEALVMRRGIEAASCVSAGTPTPTPTPSPTPTPLAPPANDNLASAIAITGPQVTGSNVGATSQSGESNCVGTGGTIRSVWWTWTAGATAAATINTNGSNFDTILGVYTGTAFPLTRVACDDDSGDGLNSAATFNAVAGTTYRIQVHGYSGATGTIVVNVSGGGAAQPARINNATHRFVGTNWWYAGAFNLTSGGMVNEVLGSFTNTHSYNVNPGVWYGVFAYDGASGREDWGFVYPAP